MNQDAKFVALLYRACEQYAAGVEAVEDLWADGPPSSDVLEGGWDAFGRFWAHIDGLPNALTRLKDRLKCGSEREKADSERPEIKCYREPGDPPSGGWTCPKCQAFVWCQSIRCSKCGYSCCGHGKPVPIG